MSEDSKDKIIQDFATNLIRLGNECRDWAAECLMLSDKNKLLQAEVEHLTSELKMEKENEDRLVRDWQRANNEVHGQATQIAALIDNQTRLKAEVERLKEGNEYLGQMHDKEMERSAYLCEQVERLEKGIQPEGSNDAVGRAVELLLEKEKEIASLKSEVERLKNNCAYLDKKLDEELNQ